jgi:hypothetical protein
MYISIYFTLVSLYVALIVSEQNLFFLSTFLRVWVRFWLFFILYGTRYDRKSKIF